MEDILDGSSCGRTKLKETLKLSECAIEIKKTFHLNLKMIHPMISTNL